MSLAGPCQTRGTPRGCLAAREQVNSKNPGPSGTAVTKSSIPQSEQTCLFSPLETNVVEQLWFENLLDYSGHHFSVLVVDLQG